MRFAPSVVGRSNSGIVTCTVPATKGPNRESSQRTMRTFGSSFPRANSAVGRFRKNTAEVAARAPTAAGEIVAGGEAAVIGPAIGAAVVGAATVEVHGAAEGIRIAVGIADSRQNSL